MLRGACNLVAIVGDARPEEVRTVVEVRRILG